MARAMVLCAGLGTRLRPLTDELPKPLIPVGDRSVLAHIEQRLRAEGLYEIVINTHYLAGEFPPYIERLESAFHLIYEPQVLGTAGGIAGARRLLEPPVIVCNGDILASPPVGPLLEVAREGGFCMAVSPRPRGRGVVGIGADGRVVRLRGERFGQEERGGEYIGVCALGLDALSQLPKTGCLIGDYALPRLRRGARVETVRAEGGFSDLGTLRSYHRANLSWLDDRGLRVWRAEGVGVSATAAIDRAVLGPGAVVEGAGRLERCVVWPNARARAPLADAVVTTTGRVVSVPTGAP